jgi:hypothetical protein
MRLLKVVSFTLLLTGAFRAFALPNFARAIRYTPPPNYAAYELSHDPGDNPFSLDGPGFMLLANDQNGQINFQIGMVGFSIGEGKVVTYQHVGPTELKKLLEQTHKGNLPLSAPVMLETASGLTTAKWSGELGKTLLHISWVQIETNLVLKITATAHDTNAFAALTNSLRTLTIDKKEFLESLKPKKPSTVTNWLDKIEVGYMRWRGRKTAVFVLRSRGSTFCFAAGPGNGNPEEPVNSSLDSLARMQESADANNVFTMAFIDSNRIGTGPRDYQTTLNFFAETNAATIAQLKEGEYHGAPLLMAWDTWTNREPEAFQKVREYKVKATLLIRKEH